ncbi:MAG: nitrilase-related carbon-nitrogen hydrolase, partial [Cyanobacteriota bacterium]
MSSFLAAALQLTSISDPDANFAAAEEQIELASRRGAELVGLPENFAFMGDDELRLRLAPELAERCSSFLVTMARRYQVTLLGGGFPVPAGEGQTFNRSELVGTEGQVLARYDKIHLFDVDIPVGNPIRDVHIEEVDLVVAGQHLAFGAHQFGTVEGLPLAGRHGEPPTQ